MPGQAGPGMIAAGQAPRELAKYKQPGHRMTRKSCAYSLKDAFCGRVRLAPAPQPHPPGLPGRRTAPGHSPGDMHRRCLPQAGVMAPGGWKAQERHAKLAKAPAASILKGCRPHPLRPAQHVVLLLDPAPPPGAGYFLPAASLLSPPRKDAGSWPTSARPAPPG